MLERSMEKPCIHSIIMSHQLRSWALCMLDIHWSTEIEVSPFGRSSGNGEEDDEAQRHQCPMKRLHGSYEVSCSSKMDTSQYNGSEPVQNSVSRFPSGEVDGI